MNLNTLFLLLQTALMVTIRRLSGGPSRPTWSWRFEWFAYAFKVGTRRAMSRPSLAEQREAMNNLGVLETPALRQARVETLEVAGRPACWVIPSQAPSPAVMLYLHGGGYAFYTPQAYLNLCANLAQQTGLKVLLFDYRLGPEHPFPAAVEDALAAYDWLLENGASPEHVVIAGDSAGGGLTLVTLTALRDAGKPLPALGVMLSPWVDLQNSGTSMQRNDPYDWIDLPMLQMFGRLYLEGAGTANPLASPLLADLRGLPPLYVQAGSAEVLIDQIQTLADCAQDQGAALKLDVFPDMVHVFPLLGTTFPQVRDALQRIGDFVRSVVQ